MNRLTDRSRGLSAAERNLTRSMFGGAIDLDRVRIRRARWWMFQPKNVVMAPDGDIWCPPRGAAYRQCFANGSPSWQAFFIHEMVHVWQAQQKGRWYLPLHRHPFCRYGYALKPGKPFEAYGIEQQAEIVQHLFMRRRGMHVPGAPSLVTLEAVIPFNTPAPH